MKKLKSLTFLCALVLVSACNGRSSVAFSSSNAISSNDDSIHGIVFDTSSSSDSSIASSSIETSSSSEASSSSQIISSSGNSSSLEEPVIYYDGYYSSLVSWQNGEDLKRQLNAIMRDGYRPLTYTKSNKQNYDTNIHADHSKYDFEYLDVIYNSQNIYKNETNKGWQREHAWCASLMCGCPTESAVSFKGRATDFHNLFAADASGNQSRGNKNYGYAELKEPLKDNGEDGYSYDEKTFEPGNIDKGRLARAIFYMATMYMDDEVDTNNGINMKGLQIVEEPVSYVQGNSCAFAIGNLSDLLEWNNNYAVDYLEMQHNITVYSDSDNPDGFAQGNRNAFVDYPGLVDYVYGNKKNRPGSLKDVVASASYLHSEEDVLSHYAIKQAKREYAYGETLMPSDYTVVGVRKDYSYTVETEDILNSYDNHTFSESDGESVSAIIATMINVISYPINLNPMGQCNNADLVLNTSGLDKKKPEVDQNVSYGDVPFIFNFSTSYQNVATDGMTINNISAGGITLGSNNRPLDKLVITTKNIYTIDRAYIKAQAGNATSSYSLKIYVGDTIIHSASVQDSKAWNICGASLNEPLTGQVSFVFMGRTSLKINSIAFNAIIA